MNRVACRLGLRLDDSLFKAQVDTSSFRFELKEWGNVGRGPGHPSLPDPDGATTKYATGVDSRWSLRLCTGTVLPCYLKLTRNVTVVRCTSSTRTDAELRRCHLQCATRAHWQAGT